MWAREGKESIKRCYQTTDTVASELLQGSTYPRWGARTMAWGLLLETLIAALLVSSATVSSFRRQKRVPRGWGGALPGPQCSHDGRQHLTLPHPPHPTWGGPADGCGEHRATWRVNWAQESAVWVRTGTLTWPSPQVRPLGGEMRRSRVWRGAWEAAPWGGRREPAGGLSALSGSFPWAGQGPGTPPLAPSTTQLHLHQRKTQLLKLELLKYLEHQVLRW